MTKSKNVFTLILTALAILAALGCSVYDSMVATSTPTATHTTTATNTATMTPTETATNTPVPTLVPTETLVPTLAPANGGQLLLEGDLPSSFINFSLEDMGIGEEDLAGEEYQIQDFYIFVDIFTSEFILGYNAVLKSPVAQAGFDLAMNDPDLIASQFMSGMGGDNAQDVQMLPALSGYGDNSAGVTFLISDDTLGAMRADLFLFRVGEMGSVALVMYPADGSPQYSIEDIAKIIVPRAGGMVPGDA